MFASVAVAAAVQRGNAQSEATAASKVLEVGALISPCFPHLTAWHACPQPPAAQALLSFASSWEQAPVLQLPCLERLMGALNVPVQVRCNYAAAAAAPSQASD